jgi:hypothetical protein
MRRLHRQVAAGALTIPLVAAGILTASSPAQAAGVATATSAVRVVNRAVNDDITEGLPSNWVARGSGQFGTSDPQDLLSYRIYPNAVSPSIVTFRLQAVRRCIWAKTLVMPDGLGSRWDLNIDPTRGRFSTENSLWAQQVQNGQNLELWKAGFLGFKYKVLDIGDLNAIPPGSKVVFTWLRDSGSCG